MGDLVNNALLDLGGSLVQGENFGSIGANEFSFLQNFYQQGKKLVSRAGTRRLTKRSYVSGVNFTGVFAYKTATGVWTLILPHMEGFHKYDPATLETVAIPTAAPVAASPLPPHIRQYKDVFYIARRGLNSLRRGTPNFIGPAGIVEPSLAPVISDGGVGGSMVTGVRSIKMTFRNSLSGQESNPSPVSNDLNLTAGHQITASNLETSTNPQVDSRRLYITFADQTGSWFRAVTIDNVVGSYTFSVVNDDLGPRLSTANGLPPANPEVLEIWADYLWTSDGTNLDHSELGMMESFNPEGSDVIIGNPDDGHKIVGLSGGNQMMLAGKTNGMHYVRRSGVGQFQSDELGNQVGCRAGHSLQRLGGTWYWYEGTDFYRSSGGQPEPIGDRAIRRILDAIPEDYKERVVAKFYPQRKQYVATLPSIPGKPAISKVVLRYNYQTGVWTTDRYYDPRYPQDSVTPNFVGGFYESNFAPVLYATFGNGHLYQMNVGQVDEIGELLGFTTASADDKRVVAVAVPAAIHAKGNLFSLTTADLNVQAADNPSDPLHGEEIRIVPLPELKDANVYSGVPPVRTVEHIPGVGTVTVDDPKSDFNLLAYSADIGYRAPLGFTQAEWKRFRVAKHGQLYSSMRYSLEYWGRKQIAISGVVLNGNVTGRKRKIVNNNPNDPVVF